MPPPRSLTLEQFQRRLEERRSRLRRRVNVNLAPLFAKAVEDGVIEDSPAARRLLRASAFEGVVACLAVAFADVQ
jgi:hypothetical protein